MHIMLLTWVAEKYQEIKLNDICWLLIWITSFTIENVPTVTKASMDQSYNQQN